MDGVRRRIGREESLRSKGVFNFGECERLWRDKDDWKRVLEGERGAHNTLGDSCITSCCIGVDKELEHPL